MAVDQAHRLVRVVARTTTLAPPACMWAMAAAEGGHVEQRQGDQVAVGLREPRPPIAVRFAAITLPCVSTAPRGITSTAAVEMTANGSSGATSRPAPPPGRVERGEGRKPGPAVSPS